MRSGVRNVARGIVGFIQSERILREIEKLQELIMALSPAVQAKVDSIKTAVDSGVAGIRADIEELKKLVGTGATDAEILAALDGLSASAQEVTKLDSENPTSGPGPEPV